MQWEWHLRFGALKKELSIFSLDFFTDLLFCPASVPPLLPSVNLYTCKCYINQSICYKMQINYYCYNNNNHHHNHHITCNNHFPYPRHATCPAGGELCISLCLYFCLLLGDDSYVRANRGCKVTREVGTILLYFFVFNLCNSSDRCWFTNAFLCFYVIAP